MSEFVNRIRFLAAGQDDPQSVELSACADRIEELEEILDLRWKADIRAIKRWQEANKVEKLVWPDHADLCAWLLERNHKLEEALRSIANVPRSEAAYGIIQVFVKYALEKKDD